MLLDITQSSKNWIRCLRIASFRLPTARPKTIFHSGRLAMISVRMGHCRADRAQFRKQPALRLQSFSPVILVWTFLAVPTPGLARAFGLRAQIKNDNDSDP